MKRVSLVTLGWVAAAVTMAPSAARAQEVVRDSVDTLTSAPARVLPTAARRAIPWLASEHHLDRARLAEARGGPPVERLLLRSQSVFLGALSDRPRWLGPEAQLVNNSALPWSMNDGALWAGRGASYRLTGGMAARLGVLNVVIAPELTVSSNSHFDLRVPWIERPPIPEDRSEWQFEWYAYGPYSIDMPTRFGDERMSRLHPGQSSLSLDIRATQLGFGTENNWWGPGMYNALVLSNNAPGFPHFFFRSARPLETRIGAVDFRWIVGGLKESDFFDTVSTNNLRSISAAAVTVQLRRPAGLAVGAARSVWGTSTGWSEIPFRWLEVLHGTGRPSNRAMSDSALYPGGREQMYSLFARWVFPRAGLETYVEWGRTEFPTSVRDLLVAPNHTQAYTLGLQWQRPVLRDSTVLRFGVENTTVEQSATYRDRPVGVWYTSRRVIQGYTHRGQPLGAAVGPGSSGQTLVIDLLRRGSSFGLRAGRTRNNEDVRAISAIPDFKSWCTHDVNLYWGPRASILTRLGLAELDVTFGNRIQAWFQVGNGCPRGDAQVDIRNTTFKLTLSRPLGWD
jgi:hypothetical protein